MQATPKTSAKIERILFVFHVLLALLGLGAHQPVFWHFNSYCWDAFLVVAALYHLYKVGMPQTQYTSLFSVKQAHAVLFTLLPLSVNLRSRRCAEPEPLHHRAVNENIQFMRVMSEHCDDA